MCLREKMCFNKICSAVSYASLRYEFSVSESQGILSKVLEKGMTTHSSILAWRIPWTEEPGGPQSTGPQSQTRLKRLSTQALGKVLLNKNTHKTRLCVIH